MDPVTGAAIAGGSAQIVQQGGNILFQHQQNKLNRNFAEGQARLQRQYANEDWEKTNAYNSPKAQKERMKEAGLNPNMMYAGGGGSTPSATVRGSAPAEYKGIAPQSNINFQSLMQLPIMMEQTRQLKLANEAKAIDNKLLGEATGMLPPTMNEFSHYEPGDDGEPMRAYNKTGMEYLKNNPYTQKGESRELDNIRKAFINQINDSTSEEQTNQIIAKSALQQLNFNIANESSQEKLDSLKAAYRNAENIEKINAARLKVMDMEIGMQDQYFIGTLIKVLSLMK